MATLEAYAARRFPKHRISVQSPAVSMTEHTTVGEVMGAATAGVITDRLRRDIPSTPVGLVLVLPNEPTVVASTKEDKEGSIDLPRRRPAFAAIALGALVGVVGLFVAREVTNGWVGAVIAASFLAVVAGVIGALVGGVGRYAGARAWQQQRQGDDVIGLVAVCEDGEASAERAAATLERMGLIDVRIVGSDGAWHAPNT